MRELLLTRTQTNDAFRVLRETNLDPAEFEWQKAEVDALQSFHAEAIVSKLVHKPTGYFIQFDPRDGWEVKYAPGDSLPEEEEPCDDWLFIVGRLYRWANRLKQEIDAPDLWAEVARSRQLFDVVASPMADRLFSEDERRQVREGLDRIERYILDEIGVAAGRQQFVAQQFAYMRDATDRLQRADWLNAFRGALIGVVLGAAVPPEKMGLILEHAWGIIKDLSSLVPLLQ